MVKIQLNLNNFSVFSRIFMFFSWLLPYKLFINEKGIVYPDINTCPNCKSPLSRNGYNESKSQKAKAYGLSLKKGRVVCPNPKCKFKINLSQSVFDKWFSKLSEFIESIVLSLGTKKLSASAIAQHIRECLKIQVSCEYVRKLLNKLMSNINKPLLQHEPSGVVVHDEQFVKIKGVDLKRISNVDANNPNVYYDKLHADRKEETITDVCEEIKKTLKNIYAVVVDGCIAAHNAYINTFIGIIVQFCLFHYIKNVRDAYKEEVGYGKGMSCIPLNYLIGFFSIINIFFDHERELNYLRKLQTERNGHIQRINSSNYNLAMKQAYIDDYNEKYDYKARKYLKEIRKARRRKNGIKLKLRTEEEAKKLLETAKKNNVFPKKVQKQIDRLEKNWINFTHCMRDEKIPPTSNKVEQFYAMTLNWIEKNNLQSEEQFYKQQKFALIKRYKLPLIKEGIFSDFLQNTFALLLVFGPS